ncbi:hypothetical protein [Sphingomonas oryzagri]
MAARARLTVLGLFALAAVGCPGISPLPAQAVRDTVKRGGEIASQPARDVGVAQTKIPPLLAAAKAAPYSMNGLATCQQIRGAIEELSAALGPDFAAGSEKKENKVGKLAEAGGKTVVNAFIPFRGLVREISGAAPAQRQLNAAIDAGFARRGFLRGVAYVRKCRQRAR